MAAVELPVDDGAKIKLRIDNIRKEICVYVNGNMVVSRYAFKTTMGEDARIVNAIASHHNDIEPESIEAVIVQIADAISAARPGARRETMDNYVKRLENLEAVAENFNGVEKAYAIQAGRELRVLVNNEKIPDSDVKDLARKIAKQIETDLKYPGRIKITMIRETRIVEYAR